MRIRPDEIQIKVKIQADKISPIIHQTWKTSTIPIDYKRWVNSWGKYNKGLFHVIWDDSDIKTFIEINYPEYIDLYKKFNRPVEIADFFRYLVVYHYGGIYADLDVECLQPIAPVLDYNSKFFCCIEKYAKNRIEKNHYKLVRKKQLCQWFFGGTRHFYVLKILCDIINEKYPKDINNISSLISTLENTGPGVFSDIILKYKSEDQTINIFPQYFFAIGACFTSGFEDKYPSWVVSFPENINKEKLVYVKHHFLGTWKDRELFTDKMF